MNVVGTAKTEFEAFYQLYEQVDLWWRRASAAGQGHRVLEAIRRCEEAISLTQDWVEKYKPHIQELKPDTGGAFRWRPMLEEIRNKSKEFRILLISQQAEKSLLESTDQIIAETIELLENHIYLPEV